MSQAWVIHLIVALSSYGLNTTLLAICYLTIHCFSEEHERKIALIIDDDTLEFPEDSNTHISQENST